MAVANVQNCYLELEFMLKPGKRREFRRSFEGVELEMAEGHVRTTIYEDIEEPGHMFWVAEWVSRAHAERYLAGDRFGVLLGGLRVVGTLNSFRLVEESPGATERSSLPESRSPEIHTGSRVDPNHLTGKTN